MSIPEVEAVEDLFKQILHHAMVNGISEIHFEPFEEEFRVRFRQGGEFVSYLDIPVEFHNPLCDYVKAQSGLDVQLKRLPQDGRINVTLGEKPFYFQVSIVPTIWGERILMKRLAPPSLDYRFESLGLDSQAERPLKEALGKKSGVIVFAGPTGAGKTTTQYTVLNFLNDSRKNIMTAEWPVECLIPGINQVDCKFKEGLTDKVALETILEQKPDIIKVKLESQDVTRLAFQAASRGILVLGSIHVLNAPGVINRLANMDIPAADLSTCLLLVHAQRLVRKICPACRREYAPSPALLKNLHLDENFFRKVGLKEIDIGRLKLFKPGACDRCEKKGFSGVIPVVESFGITPAIRHLIQNGAGTETLAATAREEGMITLREAALKQAVLGLTTVENAMMLELGYRF